MRRERYYAEVYGAIFVVDAADGTRIEEARNALHEAFSDCRIQGKPLLVFANKQDKEGAMPASEVVEKLGLTESQEGSGERLAEQFTVMACSARLPRDQNAARQQVQVDRYVVIVDGRPFFVVSPRTTFSWCDFSVRSRTPGIDAYLTYLRMLRTSVCMVRYYGTYVSLNSAIHDGISWLQIAIESDLSNMQARVEREAAEQQAEERRKVEERRRRVEAAREERRRAEAEAASTECSDDRVKENDADAGTLVSHAQAEPSSDDAQSNHVTTDAEDNAEQSVVSTPSASTPAHVTEGDTSGANGAHARPAMGESETTPTKDNASLSPTSIEIMDTLQALQTPSRRRSTTQENESIEENDAAPCDVSLPGFLPSPSKPPAARGEDEMQQAKNEDHVSET